MNLEKQFPLLTGCKLKAELTCTCGCILGIEHRGYIELKDIKSYCLDKSIVKKAIEKLIPIITLCCCKCKRCSEDYTGKEDLLKELNLEDEE